MTPIRGATALLFLFAIIFLAVPAYASDVGDEATSVTCDSVSPVTTAPASVAADVTAAIPANVTEWRRSSGYIVNEPEQPNTITERPLQIEPPLVVLRRGRPPSIRR